MPTPRKLYLVVSPGKFVDEFNDLTFARNHAKLNHPAWIYRRQQVRIYANNQVMLVEGDSEPLEKHL